MLDTFLQDLRYALRALRTSPGFAAVAILSLALGIGANTAIFSLIDSVVLKFLPVNHPEELLQVTMGKGDGNFTNPIWEQVRDRQDVFSGAFAYSPARFNLSQGGEARYARGNWVSGQFFETLGVRAILGRTFTPADDKRGCAATAVLSYDFWQTEYEGSTGVLGRSISLDGHPFQIIGVIQAGFTGVEVGRGVDVYIPICADPILHAGSILDQRSTWWLSMIARPKPGLDRKQVDARLRTIAPQVYAATVPPMFEARDQAEYVKGTLETEPASNGLSNIRAQYRQALWTLMVVAGTVLLIACANVANLLLARAAMRQKEIAIRMAIGAGRARLIRQLLTESLLLSFAGAGLGILFAQWGERLLVRLLSTTNNTVLLDLTIDGRVLGFTIAIAMLTGVLFGMAPAWKGTRVDPQAAMKANGRGIVDSQTRLGLGKSLVAVQVALSMVLVTGAGLMLNTFSKLASLDAGFEREHVLLVNVDLRNANYPKERRVAGFEDMLEHLRAVPGVRSASTSNIIPVSGQGWNTLVEADGFVAKSRRDAVAWMNRVSPGFFETMNTPFIAGRDFNGHDTLGSPMVAVINEAMAKKFLGSSATAVGKTFRRSLPGGGITAYEVIGVVKDAKYRSLREQNEPIAYVAQLQDDSPNVTKSFELRVAGPAASVISGVKDALAQVNKDIMIDFSSLATQVDESLNRERLLATLSGFFGALALLLATIGLYGVMSYNVARRRNEIGIRMALGAEQSRVLNMVLREVAVLIGAGLIVGLGAAMVTTRFVETFLYGIKPNDPWTLSLAAAALALVGAVAGFLPARKASRLDPMSALREE
jgi:putative ABC transport system permease protein